MIWIFDEAPVLLHGDCMELMRAIPAGSVDLILCDLPYGVTKNEWDKVLPMDALWREYKRVLRHDGVVALTATQPFATDLINSNRRWFRYEWVLIKKREGAFYRREKGR